MELRKPKLNTTTHWDENSFLKKPFTGFLTPHHTTKYQLTLLLIFLNTTVNILSFFFSSFFRYKIFFLQSHSHLHFPSITLHAQYFTVCTQQMSPKYPENAFMCPNQIPSFMGLSPNMPLPSLALGDDV